MKSLRKRICMVLSLCCITSAMLVGCTGTSTPSSSSGASASSSGAASSSSSKPAETVTINFWTAGTAQDDQARIVAAANKYLKETLKLNIQIDYQELGWSDDYTQKVNNALSTGQGCDVVFTANWVANFQQNALAGNFLELDSYLAKYPEIVKILDQSFINASKINGKTYALPCNKEKFHSWGYLLRKDLVDKYKIDTTKIKSEKDMEPIFDNILKNEPGVIPICAAGMDVPGWKYLDWDNISDDDVPGALYPNGSSSKIINQFTSPEAIAFYKQMKTYVSKKYISADASTLSSVSNELKTGKYFAAVQSLKPGKAAEMKASTGIEWVQVDITPAYVTNRETTGAMLAIAKQSKHPEEAMKFISLLYTDANLLNIFIYGEEGKDYTKNSDGTISLVSGSKYASGNGWRFGDQTKNLRLSYESADKYDSWVKLNGTAPKLQSYGFIFNNTNTDVQTLIANSRAVTQEYYKTLFYGQAKDVDATVAEMQKKYTAAGTDKLLEIMQTQYDAWKKK
ncbi:MAG TPA: ABC transporter substrate-binding protein [Ruminococcaceae bacterium]|nr:ABC transporter substrate-binding protein [Oscillospiraceae bacterium]